MEIRTKNLARTVFVFSAASFCAILVCVVPAGKPRNAAPQPVNSPVYTYQNPFSIPDHASVAGIPETKAAGIWMDLISIKSLSGLAGLAVLWLGSTWFFHGGDSRKRVESPVNHAKMNPLAILPPVVREQKEDIFRPSALRQMTGSRRLAHREITAPCQSRFRPVTLIASPTRFGRLE